MDNSNQQDDKKTFNEMSPKELLNVLWQALNKANSAGAFNLDEAFTLKIVHERLLSSMSDSSISRQ